MFSLLVLLGVAGFGLGIVGFFMALSQLGQFDRLSVRLAMMENKQRELLREIEVLGTSLRRERTGLASGPAPASAARPAAEAFRAAPERVTPRAETAPRSDAGSEPVIASVPAAGAPVPGAAAPKRTADAASETGPWRAPPLPRQAGFEERLGTRWAVWVGGVALALGALLLVRYSIEQGLVGPGMRMVLGALLAAGLVAAGEWLRRNEVTIGIDVIPSAHIPGVLTAAGTIAAFGTVYAAHALYGFIGPGLAFTALGAVGLAAMWAASLHGPALAGLGLAGSFLTPMLVSSTTPSPWPLVLFLAAVATAAYALAALERWSWLALAAAAGGVGWGLMLIGEAADNRIWIAPVMLHALLQLGLATYFLVFRQRAAGGDEAEHADVTATGILAAFAALSAGVLLANQGVSPASVVFTAAAAAILSAAGLKRVPVALAVAAAGALILAKMLIWASLAGSRLEPFGLESVTGWLFTAPLYPVGFVAFALAAALGLAALCGLRLMDSPGLRPWSAAIYAATATVLPLLALVIAYLRMTGYAPSLVFALAGVALGLLLTMAALSFEVRERSAPTPAIRLATGAFAAAACAALALALVFCLERGYLTVALAIGAFATAFMADLKAIPLLRKAVVALGLIVLARVVWDPRIMGDDVGATPILNWLLLGYGVPAAAFYGAAQILEKKADDTAAQLSNALAILFAGLLAFFEIRHLMNGGDVYAAHTDHVELGLMLLTAIGFAYALMKSGIGRGNRVFEWASLAYGGLGAVATVFGLLIAQNPYLCGDPVRSFGPVSSLWLGYLAPAIATAVLVRHARGRWPQMITLGAGALALTLLLTFVTLAVRHAYQGENLLYSNVTSEAEFWSYSAAWLLLGIGLLGYGLWREMPEARLASAAIVVLTILKVFLWDMSGLEGALRAFSFIGLGLVLVGIGLVYQRLVFAPPTSQTR